MRKIKLILILLIIISIWGLPAFIIAESPVTPTKTKTLVVGSSTFVGACSTNYGFIQKLQALLPDHEFKCGFEDIKTVVNSASVSAYVQLFKNALAKAKQQGIIFNELILYAGLNYITSDSAIQTAQTNLKEAVELAKQANMKVFVMGAQPYSKQYEFLKKNNDFLANKPWGIDVFVDPFPHLDKEPPAGMDPQFGSSNDDYLHANSNGHIVYCQLFMQQVYNKDPGGCGAVKGMPPGATNANPAQGASPFSSPKLTEDELKAFLQKPNPRITIPGLNFSDINIEGMLSSDESGATYLNIPFLGEYLAAVYKYLVMAIGIIAVVMLIIAGLKWILGGEATESAKKQIKNAIIGLVIAVSSYTILYTINPELVNFRNLRVLYVRGKHQLSYIDSATYQSVTGQSILPKGEIVKKAIEIGKTNGLTDPCYIVTILTIESGARPEAIGHDENYPGKNIVGARKEFLLKGLKKSGKIFSPPVADPEKYDPKIHNKTPQKNDDKFTNQPPDYGLDWLFTHGFGLGQITFGGKSYCNGQRGRTSNGVCYTIKDLLIPEKNLEFTVNHFKENLDCSSKKGLTDLNLLMGAFYSYNAGCGGLEKILKKNNVKQLPEKRYVKKAMKYYNTCKQDPQYINNIKDVSTEELDAKTSNEDEPDT